MPYVTSSHVPDWILAALVTLSSAVLEEIRLYELRHGEALSQAEVAGRLELVAVFDDEDRRVPVHLGKEPAA